VLSVLSFQGGYGEIYISGLLPSGVIVSSTVAFGFDGICVSRDSTAGGDAGPSVAQASPVYCYRYRDASQRVLSQVIPYGSHVVALAAEQLAGPKGPALVAVHLAMLPLSTPMWQ